MTRRLLAISAILLSRAVSAAPLIWDADPATPGLQDGAGTWDDVLTNWWDGAANTNWTSLTPDDATLGAGGTPGLITLGGPISLGNLTFAGAYAVTGSVLTLASPSIVTATASGVLGGSLAGGSLVKDGAADLTLSAPNSFAGGLTVRAGRVVLGDDAAAGGGTITLDGGSLLRNAAGAVVTNALVIGSSGTLAGRLVVDIYATFAGPLSGGGPLAVTGLVSLANAGNAYTGVVTVRGGSFLRLATNDALLNNPVTLVGGELTLNGGTTSTVGSISGSAGRIFNQSALPATLFIGAGDQSGSFGGRVGNGGGPMHIVKLGTGTQEFSTASAISELYGSLVVQGGRLRLNGSGYAFNTAGGNGNGTPITVGPGATLDIALGFNAGYSRLLNIAGGTLHLSHLETPAPGNGGDGGNYMNNLVLADGAQVTGNRVRVGNFSAATIAVTGTTASTLAAGINMVVAAGGLPLTLNVEDVTASPAADLTISGLIADFSGLGGMPLVKLGAGAVQISATNLYAGNTLIGQGTVRVTSSNALGAATGPILLGTAATGTNAVELVSAQTAGDLFFRRPISVTSTGSGPAIIGGRHTGGRAFFDGAVTLSRETTLLAAGNDRTQFRSGLLGTGNVVIVGGGRVTWSTSTGTTEFGNSTGNYSFVGGIAITGTGTILQLNSDFTAGTASLGGKSLLVATGSLLRLPYDADATFDALIGEGVVEAFAPGGGATGNFFAVGASGGSGLFSGRLINSGGATLHLTKQGAGVQTLTGTNTFNGTTTVSAGTLALAGAGSLSNSPSITVSNGATFDVSAAAFTLGAGQLLQGGGAVTGDLTAAAGALIAPGATNSVGQLTFHGALTLDPAASNFFNLGSAPTGTNDFIVVNGDLNPGGSPIYVLPLAPLGTGSYPLLTYTGTKSGSFDPVVRGVSQLRQSLSLDETGTLQQVNLVVAGQPAGLVWNAVGSTNWDVGSSFNWMDEGTFLPEQYYQGDRVRFDDAPGVLTTVHLDGPVMPGTVTVAADTNAFVFSGPGGIGGALTFIKAGTNMLTVSVTNSYSGSTFISNGTVVVAASAAFGLSAVTLENGVTLVRAGAAGTLGNALTLAGGVATLDDAGGAWAVTNGVGGAGALVKQGAGTVTLGAANSYAGGTVVRGGTLTVGQLAALGTGAVWVATNATLALNAFPAANAVTLEGGTLAINGAVSYTQQVTLVGGLTNTLRMAGNYALLKGALTGTGDVLVTGTGLPGLMLTNSGHSFLGRVQIATGAFLRLIGPETLPDTAVVEVQAGGNLRLEGGGLTETLAGLSGAGAVWIPTSSDDHVLRIGAGDVSSTFDGTLGVPGQHHSITLNKIGAGVFTLNGSNLYAGVTTIEAGSLVVNGLNATGAVVVAVGGTLGGTGVVGGEVTNAGTVAPGASAGRLTLLTNFTQQAGGRLALDLSGAGAGLYDQLSVAGTAALAGELSVTNLAYVPLFGDSFTVLTAAAISGTFATTNLPALDPTNAWQVTYAPGALVLDVVAAGGPPALSAYEQWAQSILNPAERGEQADPDGDGYANLLEYSQGTDATNSADHAKLSLLRTNGQFLVLFNRVNSATDIVYEVEGAYLPTNNALWLGIATNVIGSWGSSTNANDNNTAAVHRVLVTDLMIGTNRSLRLKVTRP